VAVLFRRGPSKRVEVIRWDMRGDTFERGHWFRGRIYERRCDLSPDGELLVYFASKFNTQTLKDTEYTYAWTAVSKPPWLTALALWPKGDCWCGGGLFTGRRALRLNHRPDQATPHAGHLPRRLAVEPDPDARGENDPLYSARLSRDGWQVWQEWQLEWLGRPSYFVTHAPEIRVRRHPARNLRVEMHREVQGVRYRERFRVEGPQGEIALPEGRVDWVDWDSTGRLVVLVDGRVQVAAAGGSGIGDWKTLVDLTPDRPEARVPPRSATVW
jgi:hypothetical protein